MRKILFILLSIFILQQGLPLSASAQVNQVRIKVDGLACSFCAYGLEKKLKKLDGVEKVLVALNKGIVVLESKKGQSVSFDRIETLVKDAGFTLRESLVTAEGLIQRSDSRFVLAIANYKENIILENNEILAKLLKMLGDSSKPVKVRGTLVQNPAQDRQKKLFLLHLEWFKVK